jgi:hypothetical protein
MSADDASTLYPPYVMAMLIAGQQPISADNTKSATNAKAKNDNAASTTTTTANNTNTDNTDDTDDTDDTDNTDNTDTTDDTDTTKAPAVTPSVVRPPSVISPLNPDAVTIASYAVCIIRIILCGIGILLALHCNQYSSPVVKVLAVVFAACLSEVYILYYAIYHFFLGYACFVVPAM